MADIMLHTSTNTGVTCVSNAFIDDFMKDANGEYVKIYLYLLRCLNKDGYEFSISQLADCLDHTEKDVMRAFTYWEKVGLLRLEYNPDNELSGIYFLDVQGHDRLDSSVISSDTSSEPVTDRQFVPTTIAAPVKPEYSPDDLQAFRSDSEVEDLLFVTEIYLGRPLGNKETSFILFWYDELHMSAELVQYLIESCIDNGHASFYYMDTIARNWTECGITTVEMARNKSRAHSSTVYTIMKAMGISGRDLVPSELDYVNKWSSIYGFDIDIICEACRRTITAINKPSFKYADSILTGWHDSSVTNMNDIEKLDEQFLAASTAKLQATKARNAAAAAAARSKTTNKFHNFSQRDYDFDELEKKIRVH